jgi:small subunit ribosomal protein S3
MGPKIKPIGFRVGINRTWDSRRYADRNYASLLHQDRELRDHLMERLKSAAISRVVIERPVGRARITIYAGRPGLIIGKKGADIETLRADLTKRVGSEVSLNIVEVRKPEIDAKLVAESIAQQLERRVAFRRAMKRSVQSAMRLGALGGSYQLCRSSWRG